MAITEKECSHCGAILKHPRDHYTRRIAVVDRDRVIAFRCPDCGAEESAFVAKQETVMSGKRPERIFYWKWPSDGQAWFALAFQNYGSKWIIWRIGPLNYLVQVAGPGESGGWIGHSH